MKGPVEKPRTKWLLRCGNAVYGGGWGRGATSARSFRRKYSERRAGYESRRLQWRTLRRNDWRRRSPTAFRRRNDVAGAYRPGRQYDNAATGGVFTLCGQNDPSPRAVYAKTRALRYKIGDTGLGERAGPPPQPTSSPWRRRAGVIKIRTRRRSSNRSAHPVWSCSTFFPL